MNEPADTPSARQPQPTSGRRLSPSGLILIFILIGIGLLSFLFNYLYEEKLDYLQSELEGARKFASESLATDRQFLQLLADKVANTVLGAEEFQSRASQYITYHPYLINIVWADRDFNIRDTAPFEANKQVIGLKLSLPEPKRASRLAQTTGQPAYTRPFVVLQGPRAFEVYVPIFRDGLFLGTLGGVYSIDQFLAYLAASLPHENFILVLTANLPQAQTQEPLQSRFGSITQSLALVEVPELELAITEPLEVRSLGSILLLILVIILATWLCYTSLKLSRELKQRRQVEAALRRSERLYRSIFDHAGLGIALTTVEGNMLQTNRTFSEMLGCSAEELQGTNFKSFTHPDDLESNVEQMKALQTGALESYHLEKRYLNKQGETVWGELTASCVRRDDGSPDFLIGMVNNITERRKAEQALAASEANYRLISNQFQTLLDAIPDPLYMLDRDFTMLWRNQATERLFGTQHSFGKMCHDRFFGQQAICKHCVARDCFASGETIEKQEHLDDGRIVAMRAFPVKDDDGEVVRVLMQLYDETEKLRQQETLLRTGQLAAVGELAAGVAHEINNPINGVINYAQILSDRLPEGSDSHHFAGQILHEGERIATIASSLLAYTREKSAGKRPIPLTKILAEALLLAGTKMRNEGICVEQQIPADLPVLRVSPQQIQQVFLNLLSNARYALNARHEAGGNKSLEISARACGDGKVRVTVRDNGIGIPDELLVRVRDPFFTTKPNQSGTGLGLSICNDILALHGSTLVIDSREKEFTTVSFELPCAS